MNDWQYGRIGSASAVLADGRLHVRVDGMRPAPDVEVMLAPYPHDPRSTADVQLGLYWRSGTEPDAPVPFIVSVEVDVRGVPAPTVRIYHASGYEDVTVRRAFPGAPGPVVPPG